VINALASVGATLAIVPAALAAYAYLGYPVALRLLSALRRTASVPDLTDTWPLLTITVPVYNEESRIAAALDGILTADYPTDRRHILVISDASTDSTDDIARTYAARGVELLRLPSRRGKSAAENAAGHAADGEIIVNVDASVRVPPDALKALARAFRDPNVGLASGRDVSVGDRASDGTAGESGYVGYEMWIRRLETRVESIVGASGCFYGIRRELYDPSFPEELSRDFASALMVRERGYRCVSVEDAICYVPRTSELGTELRRKVRTMARGLDTLWYKRALMNPFRFGGFAIMLVSHKLCRWLVPLSLPGAVLGLAILAPASLAARVALGVILGGIGLGVLGLSWPNDRHRRAPRPLRLAGFGLASMAAGILAWLKVLRRQRVPIWEPTRRPV
jgi:cellulose synthase/poly-beta-1,6-N-acetylglucosamine synthase-like glycosyltransferase